MINSLYPWIYFAEGDGDGDGGGGGDGDGGGDGGSDSGGGFDDSDIVVAQQEILLNNKTSVKDALTITDEVDILRAANTAYSTTNARNINTQSSEPVIIVWPSKTDKGNYQKYFDAYLKGVSGNITHSFETKKGRPNIVVIWPNKNGFTQHKNSFYKFLTDTIGKVVDITELESSTDGTVLDLPKSSIKINWPSTITQVIIDLRNVSEDSEIRTLKINGFEGARFNLFFKQIDASNNYYFYDFENNEFIDQSHSKQITISANGYYSTDIVFPRVTANKSYYFEIVPTGNTTMTVGNNSKHYKSPTIYQYIDTDTTFSLSSAGSSGSYTLPSNTVASNLRGTANSDVSLDWDVSLSASSFVVARQPILNDFKTTRAIAMAQDVSSSTILSMTSITGLKIGMDVTASGISGTPIITAINTETKQITLDVSQNFAVRDITFTGYGANGFGLYDTIIATKSMSVAVDAVTTTTTAAVIANTTVPVTSVNGIEQDTTQTVDGVTSSSIEVVLDSISNLWIGQTLVSVSAGTLTGTPTITQINNTDKKVTLSSAQTFADGITLKFANSLVSGIGIDNSTTAPYIDSISSLNLTLSAAQTLEDEIELTFTGASRAATISIEMRIIKLGSTDFTTTLQLDNILTVI